MDRHNNILEPTYLKRARQLVKKARAAWVGEATICLFPTIEEDKTMKPVMFDKPAAEQAEPIQKMRPETQPFDDDAVLDLAKRRLAAKRNLTGQALDFLLLVFFAGLMISFSYGDAVVIAFFFCLFWGGRLLYRLFKFAKPSFKDGIAAYLQKRREQQLEFEYNRLKRMSAEYVAGELNK